MAYGQLAVQKGYTAQQLGNNLAGANINIINPSIVGDTSQYGLFQFTGNALGLSSGVILSTGDINDAIGPNTDGGTSTSYGRPGDTDLTALAGFGTEDAVVFEFEFEVQGDELEFNFVFLSEEYNEFVNSGFNDVFAFYITGPGITGQENLAVVPGTTTPVTINSINNGSFWQFYNDNDAGGTNVEFDGFTTLMTARKTGLTPCSVYKLSLRIADGSDDRLDSGVLLQENSLVSNSIAVNSSTVSADTTALEGCIPARFTFNLGTTATSDINIPIRLGGSALNGVDYTQIDSIITIPSGQTASTLIINALADGITEGRETIELYYKPSSCAPEDTVLLYIDDATSITFDAAGTNLNCNNDASGTLDVNIAGGSPPYNVTYIDTATGVSNTVAASTLPVTGLDAASYLVRISDQYGCTADAVVVGGSFNAGQTFLPDGTGASYTSSIPITGFGATQTLASVNQINSICATMEHSYASDLTIELRAPNGATIMLKNVGTTGSGVNTCNLGEPIASAPVDQWSTSNTNPGIGYQYCWTATPTYATMNDMIQPIAPGPPPQYTYTTLAGNTYTDYYLPAGSYTPQQNFAGLLGTGLNGTWDLIVTDNFALDNGYIFDWSISLQADLPDSIVVIQEPAAPTVSHTTVDPTCNLNNGSIDITATGNNTPFTYLWSNGETTEDITGLLAGSYSVSITDTASCEHVYMVNLSNTGGVSLTVNVSNEVCAGAADGAIDVSTGAGTFTYNWSNGQTTEDLANLAPGSYTTTVTDASNCIAVETYTVNAAAPLFITETILNENCGDQEGEIAISTQGGQAPLSYLWSTGETTALIDDLQQGTYFVSVTDGNSCVTTDSFIVINLVGNCVPSCDLAISSSQTANENCADATGFVDLTTFSTSGPIQYNWSNGASTEDIANLSSGTYDVTLTDAIGCSVTQSFTVINQTSGITISNMNVTSEYCGNVQGAVDAVISGGVLPYTFTWSNGASTEDVSGLSAGTYTLTVSDANGCAYVNNATIINDAGTLAQTYGNAVNEVCGNAGGSIDIIFTGGQTPYTYNWSNGANTEDLLGISAGTYTCTVVDAGGCTVTTPSYVVNNDAGGLAFTNIDVDDEICSNGLGEITLSVTGGATPLTYAWNTAATSTLIGNLSAGTYAATVTDANGCAINTGNLNLVNNSGSLSLDAVNAFDETCNNGTGSVDITVSGATGPATYAWSTGSNSEDLSNLGAGNYTCTITDSVGCVVYASGSVQNDPGALSIDNVIITDEICGQVNGAINVVISGATTPATYNWSSGETTEDLSNIAGGTYTLNITDAIGCTATTNSTVQNNTGTLALSNQVLTNEVCGNGGGAINLTITGGTGTLTYAWSSGETTEDLASLSAGTYTATITDAASCNLVVGPYTINNSAGSLVAGSHTITDETCGNGAGAIDLNITGGTGSITYMWSNSSTTEDITGLSAGTYTATVTDANGCALNITETVQNNAGTLAIGNAVVADENCSDGQGAINLTISGGQTTYTFNWSNGATVEDLTGLSGGTYATTVTDANGCMVTGSYTINNNSPNFQLSNVDITNENCGDATGAVDVTLSGGQVAFNYVWSNGATTEDITGLSAGVYAGTVTDANGCVVTHSSTVQNDAGNLAVANDSILAETCGNNNGEIYLTLAGGTGTLTYAWSNGSTTKDITGLSAGTYTCLITDASGCTTNYTGTVNDLGGNLQIGNVSITDDACNQNIGSIGITATGGSGPYTYNWGTTSPCCTYTLNMYDLNNNGWGGTPIPEVNVYVNGSLYGSYTVPVGNGNSFNSVSIPVCNGNTIAVEYIAAAQNGNNQYELLDGSGTVVFQDGPDPFSGAIAYTGTVTCTVQGQGTNQLSSLGAGNYPVTVTDANGCTVSQTYTVNNSSGVITVSPVAIVDETCGQVNGSIDVTVTGGVNAAITWSTGATTEDLSNLSAGTYIINAVDPNGCTATGTYTVANNANGIVVSDTTIVDENCGNGAGSIDLTVTGGTGPYSFAWSNSSATEDITSLVAGTYTVVITDATGCDITEVYTIVNNANGISASSSTTDEACGNGAGAIDITVTGGTPTYTFNWSNGETTEDLNNLSGGIYTCTITDANTCSFVFMDTVVNNQGNLSITNNNITDANCGNPDGEIDLTVTGGTGTLTYAWSNGETTEDVINLAQGNYDVTITDANGCNTTGSYTVNNTGFFTIDNPIVVNETCSDGQGSISITVQGGGGPGGQPTFIWSNGEQTEDIANLSAGTYTVTATRNTFNGPCSVTGTYIVLNDNSALNIDSMNYVDETCNQANGSIDVFHSKDTNCTYTLNMYDSFGDDWNGGFLDVLVNGVSIGTYSCLGSATSANINVPQGQSIELVYTDGNFENENSYDLVLGGTTIFTDGPTPTIGSAFTTSCASGIPGTYTYLWSTGATTEDIANLTAGSYDLTITDGNGCVTTSNMVTLTNNTFGFGVAGAVVLDENCGNGAGSIDLTISGGTPGYTYLWSNGSTTEDLTGLSAGTYDVTVTDAASCGAMASYTVNNNLGGFSKSTIVTDESCGNSDGALDVTVTGGTPGYTFSWSNGSTTEDLNNLPAGIYTCTLADANGCSFVFADTIGKDTIQITNAAITNADCGNADGAINITISGGTGPLTYLWSNGSTTEDISNIAYGTYDVTVTDVTGCIVTGSYNVNNTATFTINNPIVVNEICGNSQGSIDITVGGGGPAPTYVWSNGAQTEDIANLSAGTYTVTATRNGFGGSCSAIATYTVLNDNSSLSIDSMNYADETCNQANGTVDVFLQTHEPCTYTLNMYDSFGDSWNGGFLDVLVGGVSVGTYSCLDSITSTDIIVPNGTSIELVYTDGNFENENSYDLTLGASTLFTDGPNPSTGSVYTTSCVGTPISYTYLWDNGSTTEDLAGLSAGSYTLTLTDANGCSITSTAVTLINNTFGFGLTGVTTNENCGDGQGAVDVTVTGGTAGYTFLWSNGSTTEDLTGLSAGTYDVTVTDAVNCGTIASYTVTNNSNGFNVSAVAGDETCGDANGSLNVTATGGVTPYTFLWSDGSTTEDLNGLVAGTYGLTVTEAGGCKLTNSWTLSNLGGNFQVSATVADDTCGNNVGSISLNPTGGVTPYTYSWAAASSCCSYTLNMYDLNNNGWGGNPIPEVDVYINGTLYGSFTVPTGNGNSSNSETIPVCTGDVISVEYIAAAQNGNNTYELVDAFGNVIFQDGPNPFSGGIAFTTTATCAPNTNPLTGLGVGSYPVTITDFNGCTVSDTFTVGSATSSFVSNGVVSPDTCNNGNGSIALNPTGSSGPYTYNWNPSAPCCNYTLNMYDLNNNGWGGNPIPEVDVYINGSLYGSFTVPTGFGNSFNSETIPVCNGDIISVEYIAAAQNGNNTYELLDGSGNVVFQDGPDPFSGAIAFTDTVLCTSSNATLSGLVAGGYNVTITDGNGCVQTDTFTVMGVSNTFTTNPTVQPDTCNSGNGSVTLNPIGGSGPYTYNWNPSAPCCSYTLNMFDANNNGWGGNPIAEVDVYINGSLYGSFTVPVGNGNSSNSETIPVCNGDIVSVEYIAAAQNGNNSYELLDASGNVIFQDGPNPFSGAIAFTDTVVCTSSGASITGVATGIYNVTATDANGCEVLDTITVPNYTGGLTISSANIVGALCVQTDGSIDITVGGGSPGYTFNWSNGETTEDISGLASGNYSVTVSDATSCSDVQFYTVPTISSGVAATNSSTDELCGNAAGAIDVTTTGGTAGYTFVWSNGSTTEDLNNLSAGIYDLTITDGSGCTVMLSDTIANDNGTLAATSASTDAICTNTNGAIDVTVTGGTAGYTYNWSNSETTEDLTGLTGGIYNFTVTDANGCMATLSDTVNTTNSSLTVTSSITNGSCTALNGAIDVTVTGGTAGYSYLWSNGETTEDLANIGSGSYNVIATDANGCTGADTSQVTNTGVPVNLLSIDTTLTSCGACSDGAIDITVDILNAPHTFVWSNGETTEDVNNIAAGSYTVTITNNGGCTLDTTVVLGTAISIVKVEGFDLQIYPNPTIGTVNIEFGQHPNEAVRLEVYNNLGQRILEQTHEAHTIKERITLELDNTYTGAYTLKIISGKQSISKKIIVVKP